MQECIEDLMNKPLLEMNGHEFFSLIRYALFIVESNDDENKKDVPVKQCTGLYKLKYEIGISEQRLRKLYHEGILDEAILYRTENARICTFDIEKARKLVSDYLMNK